LLGHAGTHVAAAPGAGSTTAQMPEAQLAGSGHGWPSTNLQAPPAGAATRVVMPGQKHALDVAFQAEPKGEEHRHAVDPTMGWLVPGGQAVQVGAGWPETL
jgi:hypothetical protein